MPVEGRWYKFTFDNIKALSNSMTGIYFLGDTRKVPVYIGGSRRSNIRGRLMAHLRDNLTYSKYPKAKYFKYREARMFETPREMERDAINDHVRKYKKFPIYIKAYPK
ncbi:MAG: hypothetical protein FJ005_00680 [Chloroflexi bacterium]|nr:hypothetical protein [Chloroflexota bacterium]